MITAKENKLGGGNDVKDDGNGVRSIIMQLSP